MQSQPTTNQGAAGRIGETPTLQRFSLGDESTESTISAPPLKGGMKTDGTAAGRHGTAWTGEAQMVGERAVFVLAHKGEPALEMPVMAADGGEAIAVFSTRELAILYLQIAEWNDCEVREVAPRHLAGLVQQAQDNGFFLLLVDPNRREQLREGEPQGTLDLKHLRELSGERIYQAILDASKTVR
jgi:hypothetical protein